MTKSQQAAHVVLLLECLQVEKCSVIFEPYGAEHILHSGDSFRVEMSGPESGVVSVWYGPGAISVMPWDGADYVGVWNAAGTELPT